MFIYIFVIPDFVISAYFKNTITSECQIFLPLQKYVSAITGIFRLMICIVGMKRVTSFSLIHVL